MYLENSHYHDWFGILFFIALYGSILFLFPYYRKMQRKPKGAFFAFVVAFAIEMHGIPFSMFLISWLFNRELPLGILWGHTLFPWIGYWGMYINIFLALIAVAMLINGWKQIHRDYWRKADGEGKLVTTGIYTYIRHPQYAAFLLLSFGMCIEWMTIPMLIMLPTMAVMYLRLAKREEEDMKHAFGMEYVEYMKRTKRFIPFVW